MNKITEKMKEFNKIHTLVSEWTEFDVGRRLNTGKLSSFDFHENSELLALAYEAYGINILEDAENKTEALQFFHASFKMWKTLLQAKDGEEISNKTEVLFNLACTGVLSDNITETRMILNSVDFEKLYQSLEKDNWPRLLNSFVCLLTLLLIRKKQGWEDLSLFDALISNLYSFQEAMEVKYLQSIENKEYPLRFAYEIAALLNLIEAIEISRRFIQTGKPTDFDTRIIRYCRDAIDLFAHSVNDELKMTALLLEYTLKKQKLLSIWANLAGISDKIDKYITYLTSTENPYPIFELWPSQIEALRKSLLDNSKISISIEMPTSAGKTFLSELTILQTLNLYPEGKVAYLVPTRALVNQVKRTLKNDLSVLGVSVEIALPIIDLAPIEEEFLNNSIDVLVTTPEKLDLLIRAKHPFINSLRLVVVDEAHSIDDLSGERGSKLELLLATLRRECSGARIRLLSPFIANGEKLADWLGSEQSHNIEVDWKPAEQYTGYYSLKPIGRANYLGQVQYIPSKLNTMYREEFDIQVAKYTNKSISKSHLAIDVSNFYKSIGGVLILAAHPGIVEEIASNMVSGAPISQNLERLEPLLASVEAEYGKDYLLYRCIEHGLAFHHAGLSLDIREQIEAAIFDRLLNPVIATTTLAQGMNFPISTVVFQSYSIPSEGYSRRMTDAEFWNIAGRAGRAMVDQEGHVILIGKENKDKEVYEEYLAKKRNVIKSSLNDIINYINDNMEFNFRLLRDSKAMSAFLQYVYHVMAHEEEIEVEDIIRGSLLYYQLKEEKNRASVEKIVRLISQYTNVYAKEFKNKNYMKAIDRTGLSNISMGFLRDRLREYKMNITYKDLIGDTENLSRAIEILHRVPEIKLGVYEQQGHLNPDLIASITKDWVNGKSIRMIAENHINFKSGLDEKIQHCGRYIHGKLVNNLSWGVSALQTAHLLGSKEEIGLEDKLLPTYIYFGVRTKEAAVMSMFGIQRSHAEEVGTVWRKEKGEISTGSIKDVQPWLKERGFI